MDRTLVGTYICKTCEHEEHVCNCLDPQKYDKERLKELGKPIKRIIPFEDYIEGKYHEEHHKSHPNQCYRNLKTGAK